MLVFYLFLKIIIKKLKKTRKNKVNSEIKEKNLHKVECKIFMKNFTLLMV